MDAAETFILIALVVDIDYEGGWHGEVEDVVDELQWEYWKRFGSHTAVIV